MQPPRTNLSIFLRWYKDYDNDGQRSYLVRRPSWKTIIQALDRLDGETHSWFSLGVHPDGRPYPQLTVRGGPNGYAVTLSYGNQDGSWSRKEATYVNPASASSNDAHRIRAIGKGYTNWEIEEQFLTDDRTIVLAILAHVTVTGDWPAAVPSLVIQR